MNERDKIIEILRKEVFEDGAGERYCIHDKAREQLTDALIATGIGDVAEWKKRAEVAERALRNITERASCNICDNFSCRYYEGINFDYNAEDCIKWWLAQAEKELAEEESNGKK